MERMTNRMAQRLAACALPLLLVVTGCGTATPATPATSSPAATIEPNVPLDRPDLTAALGCKELSGIVRLPLFGGETEAEALAAVGRNLAETVGDVTFEPWAGAPPLADQLPTTGWYLVFTKDGHEGVMTVHVYPVDNGASFNGVFGPGCV